MGDSKILEENKNFWEKRYESNKLEWHIEDAHPQLRKRINELTGGASGKRFFLPLCGKTKDIPYLLSLGHEVFGVDCVKSAIEQLSEENNLKLKFNEAESLFFTEDRRLQVYVGDFFTMPIEKFGPFDCIWDRGSFIAIDCPLRDAYIKTIERALGNDHEFRYLLQTVRYDVTKNSGPPKSVSLGDMTKYFEPICNVEELESYVIPNNSAMRKVSQNYEPDFYEIFYLLTKKKD